MRTNTGYYRDQTKRDRTPYWGQIQKWLFKAKTREQWLEIFEMLSPKDKFEVLARFNPVPKQIQADTNLSVSLIIKGLNDNKEIPSNQLSLNALPDHILDAEIEEEDNVTP